VAIGGQSALARAVVRGVPPRDRRSRRGSAVPPSRPAGARRHGRRAGELPVAAGIPAPTGVMRHDSAKGAGRVHSAAHGSRQESLGHHRVTVPTAICPCVRKASPTRDRNLAQREGSARADGVSPTFSARSLVLRGRAASCGSREDDDRCGDPDLPHQAAIISGMPIEAFDGEPRRSGFLVSEPGRSSARCLRSWSEFPAG
jgi:hypothetical protein